MVKQSASILELAKVGAAHRYNELKTELASLVKTFPHLRVGSANRPLTPLDVFSDSTAAVLGKKRKRGKLSAAGRRAISAAQKARWAKIKGAK